MNEVKLSGKVNSKLKYNGKVLTFILKTEDNLLITIAAFEEQAKYIHKTIKENDNVEIEGKLKSTFFNNAYQHEVQVQHFQKDTEQNVTPLEINFDAFEEWFNLKITGFT